MLTFVRHTTPPRHDPGLPGAPTFESANELFFVGKRICKYYRTVFLLQIIVLRNEILEIN